MKKGAFYVETYGCLMNVADSELVSGILEEAGYAAAADLDSADIILVNTCAIRENPEEKVIQRLMQLALRKRMRPDLILGIIGCVPKHIGPAISESLAGVDLILGPDSYSRLPQLIERSAVEIQIDLGMDPQETFDRHSPKRTSGVNAWITVMRGCDRFCSYCVVPYARGREKCVSCERILDVTARAAAEGHPSITLLGQTVNTYRDGDIDFAALLGKVAQIDGVARVRFTSPHPIDFATEVFEVMARERALCPHIHLPLQSGSDRMLERMNRGYTRAQYLNLVEEIRRIVPNMALSTDVIVGFPEETPGDFQETLNLMREVRFDSAFMFKYSERPKTWACRHLTDDIPDEEKGRRLREVIDLQESISKEIYESYIGREVEVLVEGPARRDPGQVQGKSPDFKTVVLAAGAREIKAGDFVKVRIESATSHTLSGVIPG
ncbi:MAG: tRNA (N6-isopentenyl adenosine(37)-C2)-methylthiotransferase MiaB [Candidatus Eisenbacteria bacterium]|uniref:tRNA-2-methylthio-N(6)-dimethylallyladenosine synthase n=1 Tax=Eiseniibacteriota bacterium TaxID=2212470 RepID=A0A948RRR6_UNCEI|nr:tRNA (N6-isopentenyl adenosine(37)-C2)-methylthiotransferase MiaB [Candidatus Eisenbacteria bacterium]